MIVDCSFDSPWWAPEAELEQLCVAAIEAAVKKIRPQLEADSEVSLLFTGDEHVQALNQQWRGQNRPTNVLSFAASKGGGLPGPLLGDIVLARQTIEKEAENQAKDRNDHLAHLVVHGFLHLLGHNHQNDTEALVMEQLETDILADLGIDDPYASL